LKELVSSVCSDLEQLQESKQALPY